MMMLMMLLYSGYFLIFSARSLIASSARAAEGGEASRESIAVFIYEDDSVNQNPKPAIIEVWGKWAGGSTVEVIVLRFTDGTSREVQRRISVPANGILLFRPSQLDPSLPDSYGALKQRLAGLVLHTSLGNSFASSYGKPGYVEAVETTTTITQVEITVIRRTATVTETIVR